MQLEPNLVNGSNMPIVTTTAYNRAKLIIQTTHNNYRECENLPIYIHCLVRSCTVGNKISDPYSSTPILK